MSNDIEEFLRRAAERRKAKSSQAPPVPQAIPVRPEYSNTRAERTPRNFAADDVPVQAILIEEDEPQRGGVAEHMKVLKQQRQTQADATQARRAGGTVKPVDVSSFVPMPSERSPSLAPQTITTDGSGFTVADRLITMLKKPEGMMQAMMLQEILNRPENRW